MGYIVLIEFLIIGGLIWYIKKRSDHDAYLIAKKIESGLELKRTMATGLYYRFNFPTEEDDKGDKKFAKATEIFLKQKPHEFEDFVAEVMRKKYGGRSFVTSKTGDFGVDFELEQEEGLYLGQAKAHKDDVNFKPIALVHSNMIKQGAKGGYVITTADFTSGAKKYAEDLDIELINGVQLVTDWLESMDSEVYELSGEFS